MLNQSTLRHAALAVAVAAAVALTGCTDKSAIRQMVECIKVYADKHIEVIFGGGYAVEETME